MSARSRNADGESLRSRFAVPEVSSYPRPRVHEALSKASQAPLTVVCAPAGAGKTTAVAAFVGDSNTDSAWCRVGATGASAPKLLDDFERVLGGQLDWLDGGWSSVDDAIGDLTRIRRNERLLLVIDDVHHLLGSSGEHVLDELVSERPTWLHIIAISREPVSGLRIATRRVTGEIVEVPADVLRWRHWEVDGLFRDFYREPLPPEDVARLTHRTEGWSAGLQLFHLATMQLPLANRCELIDDLHRRPGLVRDYLASNVIAQLPCSLQEFLVDTCVLGRIEPSLCDELRDAEDSITHISDLRGRQLFLIAQEDGDGHRYHEVLRAHLHQTLVERDGEAEARARHHRGASILERVGHGPEALQGYARAEAWDDVRRVLGTGGPVLATGMSLLALDELPPSLFGDDPWLHQAKARALVGDGRLADALEAYSSAERAFGASPYARDTRTARRIIQGWTSTTLAPPRAALEHLREATMDDPAIVAARLANDNTPASRLVAGAAELLAGRPDHAIAQARAVTSMAGLGLSEYPLAQVLEQTAILVAGGQVDPDQLEATATTLEHLGLTAVVRVVRAMRTCLTGADPDQLATVATSCRVRGDDWGAAMIDLIVSIAAARSGADLGTHAGRTVAALEALGAPVLARWASLCLGDTAGLNVGVERSPRSTPGGGGASPRIDTPDAARHWLPWSVHLHGGLSIDTGDGRLPLGDLRPQEQHGLALLLIDLGRPLHDRRLLSALWPGTDLDVAKHRLQVLMSSLRSALVTAGLDRGALARQGSAYVLRLPAGSITDVARANASLDAAAASRHAGDHDAEAVHLRAAVEIIRQPLLPTLEAMDWLDDERDHSRVRLAGATHRLAELHLAADDVDGAVHWSMASIDADPYGRAAADVLGAARSRQRPGRPTPPA